MLVLVVEPDKILGEAVKTTLEAFGFVVVWRRSAQKALDTLDDELPDLIILELQLGLHNGVEFLHEIATYPEWQHIPVIIHTINSKAQDEIFADSLEQLNVKAVLYKPKTTTVQLVNTVKQFAKILQ